MAGTPMLHAQAVQPRWDLEVRGPGGVESGDLRLEGGQSRILMQHNDRAFEPLQSLHLTNGRIAFTLARSGRRFQGVVSDTAMSGIALDATGDTARWSALPVISGSTFWPVPPRVTVRQLVLGTDAASEVVPGAWLARVPDDEIIEREYRELAGAVGAPPLSGHARAERSRRFLLGFDATGRGADRDQLATIAAGPAADPAFQRLFRGSRRFVDLHDAALAAAPHYQYNFSLTNAAAGLHALGEIAADADSATIRDAAWRLWSRMASDSVAVLARMDSLIRRDATTGGAVRALVAGYEEMVGWWRDAVRWLLTSPWLRTAQGWRSPAQLMAAFWGADSLPLPEILPTRFGDIAAMPSVAVTHLGTHLLRPENASAAEWLTQNGVAEAFAAWRPLRWGEIPLMVRIAGHDRTVVSPWAETEARPAAFFGARDAIRIDPGITPIAAVATFLHEWHHLIAAERRLSGPHPPALVDRGIEVQLVDDDPWLAEGFAEWATDESLKPAGTTAALLRLGQSEKRLAIADRDADDPHFLGYRLVRGLVEGRSVASLRDLLLANLQSLSGVARRAGVATAGQGGLTLHRPPNAAVIPEITFTWGDGVAYDLSRRLVLPNPRSEH